MKKGPPALLLRTSISTSSSINHPYPGSVFLLHIRMGRITRNGNALQVYIYKNFYSIEIYVEFILFMQNNINAPVLQSTKCDKDY